MGAFGFQLQEVPADKRIVTTTRSHSNKTVTDCVNAMEPHDVIRVGGAGNKVRWIWSQSAFPTLIKRLDVGCILSTPVNWLHILQIIQLIEGKASAYVFASPGCKKWDTCGPEAILHAVGGKTLKFKEWKKVHLSPDWLLRWNYINLFVFPHAGKLTDMFGNPYHYNADVKHMNSAGVLATLRNHDYYVSRVPQSVLQALRSDWVQSWCASGVEMVLVFLCVFNCYDTV